MTKSLYDLEVEKKAFQEGIQKGKKKSSIEITKRAILKGMDDETIAYLTDLSIEEIELIRKEITLN